MFIKSLLNNISLYLLRMSFLVVPLFFNKNVLRFRTSQEATLYFFVILILFFWGIETILSEKKTFRLLQFTQESNHKMMLLFILLMIISLITSSYRWISFKDLLLFLSYFLIYFLVITIVKDDNKIFQISHTMFLAAFIVSLYTVIQYYGWDPIIPEIPKLTSTIGQRNWISNYLFMLMPPAFFYYLLDKNSKRKVFYYIFLSLIYLNLIMLQSRGIWIAIAGAGIFGMALLFKLKIGNIFLDNKKWLVMLAITFSLISIIYSTENILNRSPLFIEHRILPVLEGEDPSLNKRILIWNVAYEMFQKKPVFGIGLGNFKKEYLYHQAEVLTKLPPRFTSYYANAQEAHNEYFQLLAEMGIIGLLVFLGIFYFFYRRMLLFLLRGKLSTQERTILLGFMMGVTGFLVHCLFTFPFHVPVLGMTFFGLVGLTVAYSNNLKYLKKKDLKNYNPEQNSLVKNNYLFSSRVFKIIMIIALILFSLYLLNFLVIKPYYAELLYFKGLRYTIDQNYTMALEKFEKAYQLNPYDGKNLHALGGTYYTLHHYEKAEYFLKKAKHYLTEVNTFYNLGLTYKETKRTKLAFEEFKTAVYLDPKHSKSYFELGLLYFSTGQELKAIEQWEAMLKTDPSFKGNYIVKYNIGLVYKKLNREENAFGYFLEALKEVPEDSPILKDIEQELLSIYQNRSSTE